MEELLKRWNAGGGGDGYAADSTSSGIYTLKANFILKNGNVIYWYLYQPMSLLRSVLHTVIVYITCFIHFIISHY